MQQTIEGILAEIDDAASTARAASMSKTASASGTTEGVAELVEKLAQAADALDQGVSLTSAYAGAIAQRPSAEQNVIDKIAEANALTRAMQLVGLVDEALGFAKTAAAKGHDEVEAFKFFYQQQLKELGA